jgi:hypothetical protein
MGGGRATRARPNREDQIGKGSANIGGQRDHGEPFAPCVPIRLA